MGAGVPGAGLVGGQQSQGEGLRRNLGVKKCRKEGFRRNLGVNQRDGGCMLISVLCSVGMYLQTPGRLFVGGDVVP